MISYFLGAVFLVAILVVIFRNDSGGRLKKQRMIVHFINGKHETVHYTYHDSSKYEEAKKGMWDQKDITSLNVSFDYGQHTINFRNVTHVTFYD